MSLANYRNIMQECWDNVIAQNTRLPKPRNQTNRGNEFCLSSQIAGRHWDSVRLVGIQNLNPQAVQNHLVSPRFLRFFRLQTHLGILRKMCSHKNSHDYFIQYKAF